MENRTYAATTRLVVSAVCIATTLAILSPTASAEERITEGTAYVLNPKQVRIGLWKSEVGLWGADTLERTTIGTSHIPWLAGLFGSGSYNVHLKHEYKRTKYYSLSLAAGITQLDGGAFDSAQTAIRVIPLDATVTTRLGSRLTVAAGVTHTLVQGSHGAGAIGPIDELGGAVGATTTQGHGTVIGRVFNWLYLEVGVRTVVNQNVSASVMAEGATDDVTVTNTTEVTMDNAFDLRGAVSTSGAVHLKLGGFHMRAGAEYGNVNVPYLNFVVPVKTWMPKFDVFVRF